MRMFVRAMKALSLITLFFFCWTFMPLYAAVAYAAAPQAQGQGAGSKGQGNRAAADLSQSPLANDATPLKSPLAKGGNRGVRETSGERFEKAVDHIRENIQKAEDKEAKGQGITAEVAEVKVRRAEIESLDVDLKKEFAATEKKLKDAKLPKEILDRHARFVKHYEDNLKELKSNLDDIEKATTKSDRKAKLTKARLHLEKTKAPSKHVPLDPNKLPNRLVKGKERAPRLKKEEFERDFPKQKSQGKQKMAESRLLPDLLAIKAQPKPVLLAFNEIASDVPLQLPRPIVGEGWGEGALPRVAFTDSSPFLLALAADLPMSDDLAETPEVQFTQDIRDLATQLGNKPARIFEWVRNNIEYLPSYGSIQGADMCLQSRQCNDIDTASLLIALLRVSNLPARYVYGTVEIPIDKVMNWVGGFSDPVAATTFIASGGIPGKLIYSGGKATKVQMEHAWVETYIPYGNYRGAIMDDSIKTWIPMDGSFKQYTYTNGFDITAAIPFSEDEYLSQVQNQNAVYYYQNKIQQYLDANMPGKSIVDVKGYRQIPQETYHFLPSTLPYKTVALLGSFSAIPDNMAAKVTFSLLDFATGSSISYRASTAELAGKRLTVSYIPETSADDTLIANYGGFLYDVPAYMLNVKPVLRVEGVIKLTGEATTLGSEQTLSLQFTQPNGNTETRDKKLLAGAYYAAVLDLQGINENVLGKRNYQLNTNVLSETAGTLGNDDLIGEHLFILATTYFLANDKVQKSGAKLFNTAMSRTISEGIASFTLTVSSVFGMTKSAMPSGINMDVAMAGVNVIARDGDASKELAYMDLHGLVGSYNEHDIYEKIDGFSSVSAVKALQTATANGIPVDKITSENISQLLPTLQIDSAIKSDIQNAINAGKQVIISQANVQINDWNGVGYIVKDTVTGAGAYMISGGLAGSDSTNKQDGMQIVDLYVGPYSGIKDRLDPYTRNTIATVAMLAEGDEVTGPFITQVAGSLKYAPYNDIDCAQLVRLAYWAAGICLDEGSGVFTSGCKNGNNLAAKYHIALKDSENTWRNGVAIFYDIVEAQKDLYGGIRNDVPFIGDMIFFNNTYDRNKNCIADDSQSHVGIVKSVASDGTVKFVHSSSSIGVAEGVMNRTNNILGSQYNTQLRLPWSADLPCTDRVVWESPGTRTNQLFSGYGTVRNPK